MRRASGTERFHAGDVRSLSKLGELFITAALWLLPGLVLAQVPIPGDDRPDLPDSLPAEQQSRSILSQHTPGAPADFADQHVVQVGAFADSANAARLLKILQQKGFPILTRNTIDEAGGTLTRVLAGPYANRGAALSAKAALEADGWLGFVRTEPVAAGRAIDVTKETEPQSAKAGLEADGWLGSVRTEPVPVGGAIYVTQETGPQSAEAPTVEAQPEPVPVGRAIDVTQETEPQSAEAPTVEAQPEPPWPLNLPRIGTDGRADRQ